MQKRLLAIYLNDHLAGATAGVELARRARSSNEGSELGRVLQRISAEIEEDKESLEEVMDRLGVRKDPLKPAAAWMAEKLGRLKLNGQLSGYSPLSRVVELEGLHIGITGKLELWKALELTAGERLPDVDLARLVARAEAQRTELERHRLAAAEEAFSQERGRER